LWIMIWWLALPELYSIEELFVVDMGARERVKCTSKD
jgi:hypothetical protein